MSDRELCYLSATDALALFDRGELSPVELIRAQIRRSESLQPRINAFTDTFYDQALGAARKSESRYLAKRARRLEGLPVAVKDEFRLKGTRRTSSSLVFQDRVDHHSDVVIDRLLRAGAIAIAKTATPEFCLLGSCHSRLFGVTRNPWDPQLTPGGSSGGTGAALAAGMVTVGTGTDIGGSIRIPAAQCGIVGYKPPYGRNPEVPVFNLDFFSHSGPMTRSVRDIALLQNVMSGPHNKDVASLRSRVRLDAGPPARSLDGWKIAFSMDLGFMEVDDSVRCNTMRALDTFQSLGAVAEQVELGWDEEIIQAAQTYWSHNWAVTFSHLLDTHRKDLTEYAVYFIERARGSSSAQYLRAMQVMVEMYQTFGPIMDRFDLFVCPTLATNRIPADFTWPSSEVEINGKVIAADEEQWSLTYPFNMLSRCPALAVPSGLGDNGVPTGIQLVARTYADRKVIEAGKAFEAASDAMPDWDVIDSHLAGGVSQTEP